MELVNKENQSVKHKVISLGQRNIPRGQWANYDVIHNE